MNISTTPTRHTQVIISTFIALASPGKAGRRSPYRSPSALIRRTPLPVPVGVATLEYAANRFPRSQDVRLRHLHLSISWKYLPRSTCGFSTRCVLPAYPRLTRSPRVSRWIVENVAAMLLYFTLGTRPGAMAGDQEIATGHIRRPGQYV